MSPLLSKVLDASPSACVKHRLARPAYRVRLVSGNFQVGCEYRGEPRVFQHCQLRRHTASGYVDVLCVLQPHAESHSLDSFAKGVDFDTDSSKIPRLPYILFESSPLPRYASQFSKLEARKSTWSSENALKLSKQQHPYPVPIEREGFHQSASTKYR
jgi:hypothetical protein